METPLITYNLRDRGRRYRGKERQFDLHAICDAVNGPACQERVKSRDMQGYFGHWARQRFGMNPREGDLDGGRQIVVDPALVTTYLQAEPDGTIHHKAEFLGTDAGQVASKLFASRTGGFSSAIDQVTPEFCGFDYVLEPNYSTNRGYALDDARDMTLDEVESAMRDELIHGINLLLDSAIDERDRAMETIEHQAAQIEELLSQLAARPAVHHALDAVVMPVRRDAAERLLRDRDFFRSMDRMPAVVVPDRHEAELPPAFERLLSRGR